MRKLFLLPILIIFSVILAGCVSSRQEQSRMSSYNSQKIYDMKQEYTQKVQSSSDSENKKYSYEDDVLKIDLK